MHIYVAAIVKVKYNAIAERQRSSSHFNNCRVEDMKKTGKDKRKFIRGPLQLSIRYTLNKQPSKGYMTNISEGGCCIYCYSPTRIKKNDPITINFNLKDVNDYIVATGKIAWVMPFMRGQKDINYAVGIKFIDLEEEDKKAIAAFIRKFMEDARETA
jgi:Tfp pilus assembly protein PilZ